MESYFILINNFHKKRIQGEKAPSNYEFRGLKKDKTVVYIDISVSNIIEKDGGITGTRSYLRDITVRKRAEKEINKHLLLEEATALASRELNNFLKADINKVLEYFGKAVSVNRAYIFYLHHDGKKMDNVYEWCSNGTEPQISNLKNLDRNLFPWWMHKLNNKQAILINDVKELPVDASSEKEILQAQDIKSLIVLPLYIKSELYGFMGFDDVEKPRIWHESEEKVLKIICDMLSKHIELLQVDEELAKYRQHLEKSIQEQTLELVNTNNELRDKNKELERLNKLFVGREFRIKELRDEIEELKNSKQ